MFDRNKNKQAAPPATDPVTPQSPSVSVTTATARSVAMIGPSIKIKGEVTGDEDPVIQGKVEGTIDLNDHEVSVSQSGQVFADIATTGLLCPTECAAAASAAGCAGFAHADY